MLLLPREEWWIKCSSDRCLVLVSAHVTEWPDCFAREWLKFRLDELPNDYVSFDDLKRLGIDPSHTATVVELP
jgi:hypothetical protein